METLLGYDDPKIVNLRTKFNSEIDAVATAYLDKLKSASRNGNHWFHLSKIYQAMGKKGEAGTAYAQALGRGYLRHDKYARELGLNQDEIILKTPRAKKRRTYSK